MNQDLRSEIISHYFHLGIHYKDIVYILDKIYGFKLSVRHLKRILKTMNLSRRRFSPLADVVSFVHDQLSSSGQLSGYRIMYAKCKQNGVKARMEDVRLILRQLDPVGVESRRIRRLRRRSYFAKGPNFVWHVDGYDKLKPFGLCIHACVCGFSRKIIWIKVYNTNNNPKVIGGDFLEAVRTKKGVPRIVRADLGTENVHIRGYQQFLRRGHTDPQARRCFIDGSSTSNQRIEVWWSFLRKECTQFWIEIFKGLQENRDFREEFLDKNLIQFCFMAIVQNDLDSVAGVWDNHCIRPSRNNVASGHPEQMYSAPALWETEDQLCVVSDEDVSICFEEAVLRSTIPCDGDVFQICSDIMGRDNLQPATNAQEATDLYAHLRQEIYELL